MFGVQLLDGDMVLECILLLRPEIMCYFVNQASGDSLPGYVVLHENEHSYFKVSKKEIKHKIKIIFNGS